MFQLIVVICLFAHVPNSHDCTVKNAARVFPMGPVPMTACLMQGETAASDMVARGEIAIDPKTEYVVWKCSGGPQMRAS